MYESETVPIMVNDKWVEKPYLPSSKGFRRSNWFRDGRNDSVEQQRQQQLSKNRVIRSSASIQLAASADDNRP